MYPRLQNRPYWLSYRKFFDRADGSGFVVNSANIWRPGKRGLTTNVYRFCVMAKIDKMDRRINVKGWSDLTFN